jgi:membrane associated rhomboid family serine protease
MSVTGVLIALTCVASFLGFSNRGLILRFAASPSEILNKGRWEQLITSGFLHADMAHLFFNMITLYFFGPAIEGVLGGRDFLVPIWGA